MICETKEIMNLAAAGNAGLQSFVMTSGHGVAEACKVLEDLLPMPLCHRKNATPPVGLKSHVGFKALHLIGLSHSKWPCQVGEA